MRAGTRDVCAGWPAGPEGLVSGAGQCADVSARRLNQEPAQGAHQALGSRGEVGR